MNRLDLATPLGLTVALLPELLLCGWALVVLLVVSWRHETVEDSRLAGWLSFAGIVLSAGGLAVLWVDNVSPDGLAQMVALDPFRYAAAAIALLSAGATILLSLGYLERERLLAPEYYPLILLATAGMMFLGGAEDLIVLFLGLEVMSVAVYVLAGYDRGNVFSSEAALKYFLIGAFASGFLLYGIALVFGATGTTNLSLAGAQLAGKPVPLMAALGLGLLLIGLGFKVAAVPFHMWAPDVYDGSPTPVTGFMATGVKAAAFAALVRVLYEAFPAAIQLWQPIVAGLAIASMVLGNLVALTQRPLKRIPAHRRLAGHARGRGLAAALSARLQPHDPGVLRIPGRAGPRRRARRDPGRHRGPRRHASVGRVRAHRVHALAAGVPRDLRLHRQVVHHHRRRGRGTLHPAGDPGADQRPERGLLSARDHGDVHEVGAERRALRRRAAGPRGARRHRAVGRRGAAVRRLARRPARSRDAERRDAHADGRSVRRSVSGAGGTGAAATDPA
jgi:hypothetical protein